MHEDNSSLSRRQFVQNTGVAVGGTVLGMASAGNLLAQSTGDAADSGLPCRVLGRTGVSVTMLAMGSSAAGLSRNVTIADVAKNVQAGLDAGVRYFDTARRYGKAEEGIGLGLGSRRKEVFLTSKVRVETIPEAEESLHTSLKNLKTDYLDLVYLHNLGLRNDMQRTMEPEGVFSWLVKQKKAGKFRCLGVSARNLPGRMPRFLNSGEVDVMMCTLNFADRYTYRFESEVLPIARQANIGIVAMKVFGGIRPGDTLANLQGPPCPCAIDRQYRELAIRYVLSIPGVCVANIGCYFPHEVQEAAEMVRNYKPLTEEEQAKLVELGHRYAVQWGEHFGPDRESAG
jgi:predicted aldo/keto reductase-like oxidoreductase